MFSMVISASLHGVESSLVHVEADVSPGLPSFQMVGYLSAQVKEAQERVRTALKNSGFKMEPRRITVNLSPADEKKRGTGYDLPIALAVAAAYEKIPQEQLKTILIAGELSLNGEVLPIPGILPIVAGAAKKGFPACMIPKANVREGALIHGISVIGVESLSEAIGYFNGTVKLSAAPPTEINSTEDLDKMEDFEDLNGQEAARRAAEIAVSGFHNLLMIGPPGSGKSSIAKRIPSILPSLSMEERLEISKIYSVSGLLSDHHFFIERRPFRAPHHTITQSALAGGGIVPRPGEISLAHKGVLFLDELAEFSRDTLEILRQPMEDHTVSIARNGCCCEFPAEFMLIAAMNPCPCGQYPKAGCTCTPNEVRRYLGRISTPLLDRIDLTVEVPALSYSAMETEHRNESSEEIRKRVQKAREIQKERYKTEGKFNASLSSSEIQKYCSLGKPQKELMKNAFEKMNLSARSYFRIRKVARTIADLAGSEDIKEDHLIEALCYRSAGQDYWMDR